MFQILLQYSFTTPLWGDGVDPALAGEWGANLALMQDRALNGRIFLQNHEYQPPRSLKGRVKDRVLGRGRVRVRL